MTKGKVKTTADNPQISAEDLRVENLIVNFKEKVDFYRANTNIKSGEAKSVDSTIWYLEAAANYTYADASFIEDKYIVDSAFIEVPVSNGEVNMSDIQAAYDELASSINEKHVAIEATEKELILADVSTKEQTNNMLTLKVTTGIGTGVSAPPTAFEGWIWGFLQGSCADPQPVYDGQDDAATILTKRANADIRSSAPAHLPYFTSIEIVEDITPEDVFIGSGLNQWGFHKSKLYFSSFLPMDNCVPADAMAYYYDKLLEIPEDFPPSTSSLVLGKVKVWGDFAGADRKHFLHLYYGEWHQKDDTE